MKTYIGFFRGINVGGKNILPMKDLVNILECLGCTNVRTYIQSGNGVFRSKETDRLSLARTISAGIYKERGFKPTVLLLEPVELQKAADNNPFETENGKALHFFFLHSPPQKPSAEQLSAVKSASEQFKLTKNVFYLFAPEGIGRSRLAARVEQILGVEATARNWNTVSKLLDLARQI
ncbi:MAG: DUF1697 domain-containing protein [Calditrichia bacterium]